MDAAGVEGAVVTQEYLDGDQNAYLADVKKKQPRRFFVHGLLDFRKPAKVVTEFNRVVKKYGFRGIKLPASYLTQLSPRVLLTDSHLMKVFEQMEDRKMILSVDLDYGDSQVKEMREVAWTFPDLIIVIGHFAMAGRKGWLKQLLLANEPNVYIESGGITWLFRREYPPFLKVQDTIKEAVSRVGAEKLLWGSDFPRTMVDFTYEQTLDFLRYGCDFLSDGERRAILGQTSAKIYGFKKPKLERKKLKKITELG